MDPRSSVNRAGLITLVSSILIFQTLLEHPQAVENRYITFNNVKARSLAMGGAYSSVEDDFSSMIWNPAAFGQERRFEFFLNPIAPLVAIHDLWTFDRKWRRDEEFTLEESILALGLLLRGVTFSTGTLNVGLLSSEELLDQKSRGRIFSAEPVFKGHSHTAAFSLKLAPAVSLGVSLSLYYERDANSLEESFSFGVMLKPGRKINVGLTVFNLPDNLLDSRRHLERIGDETINGGISYYFDRKTIFAFDLRNLNEAEKAEGLPTGEIHMGFERAILWRAVARAGYFRRAAFDRLLTSADDVYSLGFGLSGSSRGRLEYNRRSDILGYAYIVEEHEGEKRQWHVLSFVLRL